MSSANSYTFTELNASDSIKAVFLSYFNHSFEKAGFYPLSLPSVCVSMSDVQYVCHAFISVVLGEPGRFRTPPPHSSLPE